MAISAAILIRAKHTFNSQNLTHIQTALRQKLGNDFTFELKQVSDVQKTNTGKHKWLVSEIK